MDKYFNSYREMISLRGFTRHTMKSYCTYIRAYLSYLSDILHKDPADVSWQEMRDYIKWLQGSRSLSDRTVNTAISQLRFFTMYVLHKPWDDTQIPLRRFDTYIPFVPTREEIASCFSAIPDLKEKTMLVLMYSSGLRLGEVCSLRYEDINRSQMRIYIHHAKSRSSRYAILSRYTLDLLTSYWFECGRPKSWLFPANRKPGAPYSPTSFSNKFVLYRKRFHWNERLTCHSFRHAFGTHLYENGTDLFTIKELLGHKSLLSSTLYIHLANNGIQSAISPFDQFGGDLIG
ncbi:MAG: tyrosine-type recombinase/integrase [Bacillota bacterium]|nr:tyrosine-type recombinase/integrase [Bacillota bacterium]